MTWHAIDMLDESVDATKRLLLPFSLKRWLVLGIVVFFVSGTGVLNFNVGVPDFSFDVDQGTTPWPTEPGEGWNGEWTQPIEEEFAVDAVATSTGVAVEAIVILLLVGLLFLLAVLFGYVSSVMQFVFVRVAASEDVRIRGFFGESMRKGLSLFAFQIAVGLTLLAIAFFLIVATVITGGLFLILLLLLSPVFVVLGVGLWLLFRFTIDFVVPAMIADDVGIVAGWQGFWPELRSSWKQYGGYAGVRFLLGIAASMALGVGGVAIAVAIGIPFAILGLVGFFVLAVISMEIAMVFAVGVVLLYTLVLVAAVVVFVQAPVQTYLRYYALFVLGSVSPRFDLVADIREELQAETAATEEDERDVADDGDDDSR